MSRIFSGSGAVAGWSGWAWVGVAISIGASVAGATVLSVGGAIPKRLAVLSSGVGSSGASSSSLVAVVSTSCAVVVIPSLGGSTVCSVAGGGLVESVVVKKTVHKRNWSTKAWEPALHTHARQEAYKDEVGTCEDRSGWIW